MSVFQPFNNQYSEKISQLFGAEDGKRVKTITFQITNDCNLKCSYCYQQYKNKKKMTFEIAKKFIDKLFNDEYDNYGFSKDKLQGVIFDFIGGEPLLEITLITQICDYIERKMIETNHPWLFFHKFSLCSNGVLYFQPEVQNFIKKYKSLLSMNITVDGNKELHDSCRKFPDGSPSYELANAASIDLLKNYGIDNSKITISPDNVIYLSKAIIHFINQGFTEIHANCAYEKGWELKHASIFYNELKIIADYIINNDLWKTHYISLFNLNDFIPLLETQNENWCGGNGQMLAVTPDGILFPCIRYTETSLGSNQEPLSIGTVDFGIGITELDKKHLTQLENITRRSQSTDECFNCPIGRGCSWCSAYNYQEFGTLNKRATYICEMHKARALANNYFWNKLKSSPGQKINCYKEWAIPIIGEDEYNYLKELEQEKLNNVEI